MTIAIQQAYLKACLAELEALKPGNVHLFADGHGMQVQDFIESAEVSAPALCDDAHYGSRPLGQRMLQALEATHDKVGCNTNLGIILLAGPLVQARLQYPDLPLQQAVQQVLQQTTLADAAQVYAGIRRVSPAGMGQRAEQDVAHAPTITLLEAMQLASPHDMVARQYAEGYDYFWAQAVPLYVDCCQRWERPAWALTAVYLHWLARFPDSHVARKYGAARATALQQEAISHAQTFIALDNPKTYMPVLLQWDHALKQQGINPGTSADLTVTTALLASLSA